MDTHAVKVNTVVTETIPNHYQDISLIAGEKLADNAELQKYLSSV